MPIYEYRCKACGHEYERFQRITDDTRPACDACGAEDVMRLVSASAFHLKGSGWYVTDYKGKNAGNGAVKGKSDEAPAKDSPSSDTPSSDTPSSDAPAKSTKDG